MRRTRYQGPADNSAADRTTPRASASQPQPETNRHRATDRQPQVDPAAQARGRRSADCASGPPNPAPPVHQLRGKRRRRSRRRPPRTSPSPRLQTQNIDHVRTRRSRTSSATCSLPSGAAGVSSGRVLSHSPRRKGTRARSSCLSTSASMKDGSRPVGSRLLPVAAIENVRRPARPSSRDARPSPPRPG